MDIRKDKKGNFHVVERGRGVIAVFSVHQAKILQKAAESYPTAFWTETIYNWLFGLPETKGKRHRAGQVVSASQRASISRSLRKLEKVGAIERFACADYATSYLLTAEGLGLAKSLEKLTDIAPSEVG